jgi:hypothetical protein
MNLQRLSHRICAIPLFSALGSAIDGAGVTRIASWDDWAGPEAPLVEQLGLRQQALHDSVVPAAAKEQWDRALHIVVAVCARLVPYDEVADAWHGPNMAVWSAAWTFALEEAILSSNLLVPAELSAQIFWYECGHWPCALVSESRGGSRDGYIIL